MEQSLVDDIIVRLLDAKERRSAKQVQLSKAEIWQLCLTSKDIFISQPNFLELEAPINICGDIHGRLTDLHATTVNNENFACVVVKNKLHLHLRHGSTALEAQIRDFVKDIEVELDKPGVNFFGLRDFKAPKVLGDIVESIASAIFLDNVIDTTKVWEVFQPLLQPMVTLETLPMHLICELQKHCQQQAEGLEYKASRTGNMATVEVFVDGVQIGFVDVCIVHMLPYWIQTPIAKNPGIHSTDSQESRDTQH